MSAIIDNALLEIRKVLGTASQTKSAFQPPPGGGGGQPPMDPAMAAQMQAQGGQPPMDPAMAAQMQAQGQPPMDPAMAAQMQAQQQAMMQAQAAGAPPPPADPAAQQAPDIAAGIAELAKTVEKMMGALEASKSETHELRQGYQQLREEFAATRALADAATRELNKFKNAPAVPEPNAIV